MLLLVLFVLFSSISFLTDLVADVLHQVSCDCNCRVAASHYKCLLLCWPLLKQVQNYQIRHPVRTLCLVLKSVYTSVKKKRRRKKPWSMVAGCWNGNIFSNQYAAISMPFFSELSTFFAGFRGEIIEVERVVVNEEMWVSFWRNFEVTEWEWPGGRWIFICCVSLRGLACARLLVGTPTTAGMG